MAGRLEGAAQFAGSSEGDDRFVAKRAQRDRAAPGESMAWIHGQYHRLPGDQQRPQVRRRAIVAAQADYCGVQFSGDQRGHQGIGLILDQRQLDGGMRAMEHAQQPRDPTVGQRMNQVKDQTAGEQAAQCRHRIASILRGRKCRPTVRSLLLDEFDLTVVVDNETDTLSSVDAGVPQLAEIVSLLRRIPPSHRQDGHDCVTVFDHLSVACHGLSVLVRGQVGERRGAVLKFDSLQMVRVRNFGARPLHFATGVEHSRRSAGGHDAIAQPVASVGHPLRPVVTSTPAMFGRCATRPHSRPSLIPQYPFQ